MSRKRGLDDIDSRGELLSASVDCGDDDDDGDDISRYQRFDVAESCRLSLPASSQRILERVPSIEQLIEKYEADESKFSYEIIEEKDEDGQPVVIKENVDIRKHLMNATKGIVESLRREEVLRVLCEGHRNGLHT